MSKHFGFYKNLPVNVNEFPDQMPWISEHCMWPRDSYRQGHQGELPPFYHTGHWTDKNTQFWQLKESEIDYDFREIKNQIPLENHTIGMIKIDPGCTLPWHKDSFYMLRQKRQDWEEQEMIPVRYLILLEDWKNGHFIQFENTVVSQWRAGDCWFFCHETFHLGTNAGLESLISLQVSGFQKKII
jgi:hypothetical protein